MELRKIILAQALREKRLSGERRNNPKVFHASEAGDCSRAMYFRRTGVEEERDFKSKDDEARVQMLLDMGRHHQDFISGYIKRAPNVHLTNVEHTRYHHIDDFMVVGSPDGVIHDSKTKERFVLEVKGLGAIAWKIKQESLQSLREHYPSAIPQARVYSSKQFYDTDGAKILCVNKQTNDFSEITLDRNEKAEEGIFNKYQAVRVAILKGKEPDCDVDPNGWQCKYCPFKSKCGR